MKMKAPAAVAAAKKKMGGGGFSPDKLRTTRGRS
ncbi:hypothetical protein COLO4_28867 [Corchorus olitorius]|uniref:Uncharacterized protein n=1 Tax=Corchorus olitorius TaxID=93759 RepID=A0A1R3HHS8_9ROSI|nr:hypothetical protein COLO4_28867 [Corchorus olitorius]